MEKEVISRFLNTNVKLVKDDNFVIYGSIQGCYNNGILFFTNGKSIFLSYNRINEIVPLGGGQ